MGVGEKKQRQRMRETMDKRNIKKRGKIERERKRKRRRRGRGRKIEGIDQQGN